MWTKLWFMLHNFSFNTCQDGPIGALYIYIVYLLGVTKALKASELWR